MYVFILGLLGVWRITHLLHIEDGPDDVIVKLRWWAGNSLIGQAMDCFYCLSLWVAVPFALLIGQSWLERALLWPALSAGAIALNLTLQRLKPAAPVPCAMPRTKRNRNHNRRNRMCNCGKSRQSVTTNEMTPTGTWREANHAHPLSTSKPAPARARGMTFEYAGATALTVFGPLTGVRYRFDHPGARVTVDERDAAAMAAVPNLKQAINS